jgi:pilus assembly protein CpaE
VIEADAAPAPTVAGRVIALYSGKGGVGNTTIAANLAAALADQQRQRVVLVDLDLQYGDVGMTFHSPLEHSSISDLVSAGDGSLDPEMVLNSLVGITDRLRILTAPPRPELADLVDAAPAQVAGLIAILRANFDVVVVDIGRHLGDAGATVLDACDHLLLVTVPLTTALKNLRLVRGVLERLQIPDSKIEVVLNQPNEHSDYKVADIEQAIQRKVLASIPNDSRVAVMAIDTGEPFVLYRQRSGISAAVIRLSEEVMKLRQPMEAIG